MQIRLVLIGLALATLTACGSGGGGTPPVTGPDLFSGAYGWAFWSGDVTGPDSTSEWGSLAADGAGGMAGSYTRNTNAILSGPSPLTQTSYAIDAARRITLNGASALLGGIAADGSAALLGVTAPGNHPGIAFLLKKVGTFNLASLSGDYHLVGFLFAGPNDVALWGGSVTFDGAGAVAAVSVGRNTSGTITPPGAPAPEGTYTVAPDGTVVWTTSVETVQGCIGGGGEIVVFTGATGAVNPQEIFVLIKKATTASSAVLSGTYHSVSILAFTAPPQRFLTATQTIVADGAGMLTFGAGMTNFDGATSTTTGGTTQGYAVAADGAFSSTPVGLLGGAAASGRYAAWAGLTTGGSPWLQIFIR